VRVLSVAASRCLENSAVKRPVMRRFLRVRGRVSAPLSPWEAVQLALEVDNRGFVLFSEVVFAFSGGCGLVRRETIDRVDAVGSFFHGDLVGTTLVEPREELLEARRVGTCHGFEESDPEARVGALEARLVGQPDDLTSQAHAAAFGLKTFVHRQDGARPWKMGRLENGSAKTDDRSDGAVLFACVFEPRAYALGPPREAAAFGASAHWSKRVVWFRTGIDWAPRTGVQGIERIAAKGTAYHGRPR
jgi:hypothetical protein